MQKKGFLALAAATAVLVVLAIIAVATGNHDVSRAPPGRRALPGLAGRLGEVAAVDLRRSDLTATFRRQGERWLVAERGDYPANSGRVRQLVLAMAELTLVEPKTERPALYPRLEVEDPGKGKSSLVSLKDKAGKTLAALIIGKRRYDRLGEGNDGVYVRKPGAARSWLARGSIDLEGAMSSWLDREILDIPEKRIAKMQMTGADGARLVVSRAAPQGTFAVEGAPPGAKFKGQDAIAAPAAGLAGLELEDVTPAGQMPVPAAGVASAAYTTFDGLEIDLRIFDHGGAKWAAITASGTGKAADEAKKIAARLSHWRYAIPSYKAGLFTTKFADLLEPPKS
jgi:uncharacterized protein DUF4340